ncbi:MAG: methionine adenosyltransferase [Candidatus Thermoplasmatota archaeon]
MERNIIVEQMKQKPVEEQEIEIVERKGLGHPDTVADALAESVSRALCREYIKRFGHILHHNTDEAQIVAGLSAPKFGGGTVVQPTRIILVGRATSEVGDEKIPVGTTAISAARKYLRENFPNMDLDAHIQMTCYIGTGSLDLRKLFDSTVPRANDTSFGVGFAPYTETEKIVLETEKLINGPLKKKLPQLGEDVKVMASRNRDTINLTVAVATIDSKVPDMTTYINIKKEVKEALKKNAMNYTDKNVNVFVNTADNYDKGLIYLTVTGLSMENGDDGSVGRGNRVNGLITPFRPMSLEASAGKNPVTHVGKIYNILAFKSATQIVEEGGGDIAEAHVRILSQIGRPINEPHIATIHLIMSDGKNYKRAEKNARDILDYWLTHIGKITEMVVNDKISVF